PSLARDGKDVDKFRREIGWREFSYHLLFNNPALATKNYNASFDGFAWQNKADDLKAWQQGRTGYPIVDAGMRQLWKTGW
ncbi:deoxyribodipyrimidine photo-lyase, partial [Escherichia coli]|nr:deoxyribodipyrimidine photo-lyase [Escherichia coli]